MHIRLLGTAAAEGWPAVFCRCESCARARVAGGKNIRTRSGATVDGRYQFDFGPDAYHQALAGNDLSAVEHLIFTHSHQDHLAPADLDMRRPPFAHGVTHPLRLWGNGSVVSAVRAKYPSPEKFGLELTQLNPFEPVEIGHATVVPLLADHDKSQVCLLYLFGLGGSWLLYGHDTGIFPEPTWDYLTSWAGEHHRLDVALLDCTNGPLPGERVHMGLDACARIRERLLRMHAGSADTRFVVTHFSHNGGLLHDELVERATPLGLEVAYDGMEITVG